MDPSFRYRMWAFERRAGHMFADSTRFANLHAALLALSIGGLFTVCILSFKCSFFRPQRHYNK